MRHAIPSQNLYLKFNSLVWNDMPNHFRINKLRLAVQWLTIMKIENSFPSPTSVHIQKKQMTSSYPLDWPLARFSKNFISKISFTPSEWTASVKSSSVVHWKIFLIFNYESLSKTPGKGQLNFPWIFECVCVCVKLIQRNTLFRLSIYSDFWSSHFYFTIQLLVQLIHAHFTDSIHVFHNGTTEVNSQVLYLPISFWNNLITNEKNP